MMGGSGLDCCSSPPSFLPPVPPPCFGLACSVVCPLAIPSLSSLSLAPASLLQGGNNCNAFGVSEKRKGDDGAVANSRLRTPSRRLSLALALAPPPQGGRTKRLRRRPTPSPRRTNGRISCDGVTALGVCFWVGWALPVVGDGACGRGLSGCPGL